LESFGAFIKSEREKKGVSLKQISTATKISHHILEALESDQVEEFPYPAFAKGFLHTYAKQLGLNSSEVISRYEDFVMNNHLIDQTGFLFQDTNKLGRVGIDQTKILTRAERMQGKRVLPAFLIVFLIVGIWFAWSIFLKQTSLSIHDTPQNPFLSKRMKNIQSSSSNAGKAKLNIPETQVAKVANSASTEIKEPKSIPKGIEEKITASSGIEKTLMNLPGIEDALIDTAMNEETEVQEEPNEKPEVTERRSLARREPVKEAFASESHPDPFLSASADENTIIEEAAQEPGPRKELIISAVERTWIDVGIDDRPRFDFILENGNQVRLEASEQFSICIGNAGGVILTYEGETLEPLGGTEEVVRVNLPYSTD